MKNKTDLGIWTFGIEPAYNNQPVSAKNKLAFNKLESIVNKTAKALSTFLSQNPTILLQLFANLPPGVEKRIKYKKLEFVAYRNDLFTDCMYLSIYLSEFIEVSFFFHTPESLFTTPTLRSFCAEGTADEVELLCDFILREIS